MIGIIDYEMGNLRSVQKALEFVGFQAEFVTSGSLNHYEKLILPGVGAFCDAIGTLKKKEMDKRIKDYIETGKPFLGICLGLQLLFDTSEENGIHEGLGILKGKIKKLDAIEKIPHMGWNSLSMKNASNIFKHLPQNPYVYFVHSYYAVPEDDIVTASTTYGIEMAVAVKHKNIEALQFHPEKSGDIGLMMLKNFGG